ncbi:CAAX protease [Bacillus sp. PS194]|uniref:CAAX protease n=1 Tax=Bacillus TaxID=1386 RepID=UPI000FF8FE62|nr:CAAX protease [Bacillus subtilis]MBW4823308.1 CAAX protease [Bacillaceae bacterium]QAR83813.1 CAAX protease [Bacillus subtilis]TXK63896.1 CAAX protease [Bacillus subtilis]WMA42308.1 CAAX protease [Bacillus subtilis]
MKVNQTSTSYQKDNDSFREFIKYNINSIKRTLIETEQLLNKVGFLKLLMLFSVSLSWITYVIYFEHVGNFILRISQGNILIANLVLPVFQTFPLLLSFIYVFKGNYRALFFKVKFSRILIYIILGVLTEIILSVNIGLLLKGIKPSANPAVEDPIGITIYSLSIGLIAEQILFYSVYYFFFLLFLKVKLNNKIVVIISLIPAILIFGLAHLAVYNGNVLQCVFLIGLPFTLMQVFLFFRSGNFFIGYIVHLVFDITILLIAKLT